MIATIQTQAPKSISKEDIQEQKIQKLIKKMTLQEKISLLHGNSKFTFPE
jgi:beta-glucosidase